MDNLEWAVEQIGMRQLEVFFHVVDSGSFSAAAEELNIRQPTVSNHINRLEELLDNRLILRENDELKLTQLGRLCYKKLRSVEAAKDDFRQALYEYFEAERGTIYIGASTIPGEILIPRALPEFRKQFPDVDLDVRIEDSSHIISRVRDGDIRYGIIGKDVEDSAISSNRLFEDRMSLVGNPAHTRKTPISFDDLAQLPYVGRRPGSGTLQAVENYFEKEGKDPDQTLNRVARLETVQAVKEAVLSGLGVSFLPWSVVAPEVDRGTLVTLDCEFRTVRRSFYGIKNRFLGLSPLLREFEQFLSRTLERKARTNA